MRLLLFIHPWNVVRQFLDFLCNLLYKMKIKTRLLKPMFCVSNTPIFNKLFFHQVFYATSFPPTLTTREKRYISFLSFSLFQLQEDTKNAILSLHRRYIRTSNSSLCSRLLQPRCTNYLRPSPSNLLAFAEGHPSGPAIKESTLRCNLSGAILRNYRGPRAGTKYKIVFRPLDQCGGRW